jgi:hypothetical protein
MYIKSENLKRLEKLSEKLIPTSEQFVEVLQKLKQIVKNENKEIILKQIDFLIKEYKK